MTDSTPGRRHFLALTGAGAAGLAGCMDRLSDDSSPQADVDGPTSESSNGEARTVTMIVQPDPTALRDAQVEISQALEDGDLEEPEAREQLAERERELIEASIADTGVRISEAGASQLDAVPEEGTLLVEGEPGVILDLLEEPLLTAVLSERRFEEAQQRATIGEAEPDEEELPDDLGEEGVSDEESDELEDD